MSKATTRSETTLRGSARTRARCSFYLLYWYKNTNTDAAMRAKAGFDKVAALLQLDQQAQQAMRDYMAIETAVSERAQTALAFRLQQV